jgi:hypothetical protein
MEFIANIVSKREWYLVEKLLALLQPLAQIVHILEGPPHPEVLSPCLIIADSVPTLSLVQVLAQVLLSICERMMYEENNQVSQLFLSILLTSVIYFKQALGSAQGIAIPDQIPLHLRNCPRS